MVSFEKRSEQFIEGSINLIYVFPSELRIAIHHDNSIFLNNRLNFLDSLLVRETPVVNRLFLISKLNRYVILRLLMNDLLLHFLMDASLRFLRA